MRSRLLSIRQTVAGLRAALLANSREEIDASMVPLQQAAATLEHLRIEAPGPDSRGELEFLSKELRAASRLISHGLALNLGMARLLAPMAAGYRRDGEPAPLRPSGTLLVRG